MIPTRFSRHARRRMEQRGITQTEVESILRQPDRVEPSVKGRRNAFGSVPGGVVRVTFRETTQELVVVTVVRLRKAREARS
ncbi:MAG: DUF4258 domain-containing protein [Candidatus Methylomirabilales bacterium]